MNTKLLFLFIFSLFKINAQSQYLIGTTNNENGDRIQNVTVLNIRTNQSATSDNLGNFVISAKIKDELRFVKNGYERTVILVQENHFKKSLNISLIKNAQEIQEVEIVYLPTGNLSKDIQHYGDTKKTTKLKSETAKYIRSQSTEEVLAPKRGEFVQPLGKGFVVGKIDLHWDDVDFMQFLLENLGIEFFTQDLQLKPSEIQPFIYYIFRNFERQDILFKGFCNQYDLSRFISEANNKLVAYHQNLPNNPPIKRKRK